MRSFIENSGTRVPPPMISLLKQPVNNASSGGFIMVHGHPLSSQTLDYQIVDVFTETALEGNGLAVVFDTVRFEHRADAGHRAGVQSLGDHIHSASRRGD